MGLNNWLEDKGDALDYYIEDRLHEFERGGLTLPILRIIPGERATVLYELMWNLIWSSDYVLDCEDEDLDEMGKIDLGLEMVKLSKYIAEYNNRKYWWMPRK